MEVETVKTIEVEEEKYDRFVRTVFDDDGLPPPIGVTYEPFYYDPNEEAPF